MALRYWGSPAWAPQVNNADSFKAFSALCVYLLRVSSTPTGLGAGDSPEQSPSQETSRAQRRKEK